MKNKINKQKGQVVLMVLLASALILTLGLSASKQATIETKIDTDQELLKKAFNAAESGIEYYLGTGKTQYGTDTDGKANLNVKTLGDSERLSFGNVTLAGGIDYFWLVGHNADGSLGTNYYSVNNSGLNVCTVDGSNVTFKIDYFYKNGAAFSRKSVQQTTSGGCVTNYGITDGDSVLLTVTPVDRSVKVEIRGATKFPVQGEEITSTGSVQGVNNTVTVLNKYDVPLFMLEAVTSAGEVTNK